MQDFPATPVSTVEILRNIATTAGLRYVYTGNVPPGSAGENTVCPKCGKTIIKRRGFEVLENHVTKQGKCKFCGERIYGRF